MGLITITPAAAEPITVAEARVQCNVEDTVHDAALSACIAGARARCEGITAKALIWRTVEQNLDAFPAVGELKLRGAPAASVVSVSYTDEAGAVQTMAPGTYTLDATDPNEPWLLPAYGTTWPATLDAVNAVRVRYVAGFGATGASVPADIRTWLLMTVAYLFSQREALDATGKVAAIPGRFVDGMLDPWRVYGF